MASLEAFRSGRDRRALSTACCRLNGVCAWHGDGISTPSDATSTSAPEDRLNSADLTVSFRASSATARPDSALLKKNGQKTDWGWGLGQRGRGAKETGRHRRPQRRRNQP